VSRETSAIRWCLRKQRGRTLKRFADNATAEHPASGEVSS
jgi:hypothetical protein